MKDGSIYSRSPENERVITAYAESLEPRLPDGSFPDLPFDDRMQMTRGALLDCVYSSSNAAVDYDIKTLESGIDDNRIVAGFMCYRTLEDNPKIVGGECIPRHLTPQGTVVTDDFARIASTHGKWGKLSEITFHDAFRFMGNNPSMHTGINTSPYFLSLGEEAIRWIAKLAEEYGTNPSQIHLEILEWVDSIEQYIDTLFVLQGLGVHIGLDDFPDGNTRKLLQQGADAGFQFNFLKTDGATTTNLERLEQFLNEAGEAGITHVTLEGSQNNLLYRSTLDGIRDVQDKVGGETTVLVEGPVYRDHL